MSSSNRDLHAAPPPGRGRVASGHRGADDASPGTPGDPGDAPPATAGPNPAPIGAPGDGPRPADAPTGRRALVATAVSAALLVGALYWSLTPHRPSTEYRPSVAGVVVSATFAVDAFDVVLDSGTHVAIHEHDAEITVHGLVASQGQPITGDLLLADPAAAKPWFVDVRRGFGSVDGPCFQVSQTAFITGDRVVFGSGLSVPLGSWKENDPRFRERLITPAPDRVIDANGGVCLDAAGRAIGPGIGGA